MTGTEAKRTAPGDGGPRKRVTAFLVDRDMPGVRGRPAVTTTTSAPAMFSAW